MLPISKDRIMRIFAHALAGALGIAVQDRCVGDD